MICGRPKRSCNEINYHTYRRESLQAQNKQRAKHCAMRVDDKKNPCKLISDNLGNFVKCETPKSIAPSRKNIEKKTNDRFDYGKFDKIKKRGTEPYTLYQAIFHNKLQESEDETIPTIKEFVDKYKFTRNLQNGIVSITENTLSEIAKDLGIHLKVWVSKKNEWMESNTTSKNKVHIFYENNLFGAASPKSSSPKSSSPKSSSPKLSSPKSSSPKLSSPKSSSPKSSSPMNTRSQNNKRKK
jgi:hypothetical protein